MLTEQQWVELAEKTGRVVAAKNAAYGDSVRNAGWIMEQLYPKGISVDQISTALVVVRILDKLSRLANNPRFGGEDPALDITGYGLLLQDLTKNGTIGGLETSGQEDEDSEQDCKMSFE